MISDLQTILDSIPAVRGVGMQVQPGDDGLSFTAQIGAQDARYDGASQAHGGTVAAILDTAATCAIFAQNGDPWMTLEMNVSYLRAVPLGPVRGEATIVHSGRTVTLVRTAIYDDRDRRCADASVLLLLPPPAEGTA